MIIQCTECRQYVEAKEAGGYWRHFDGKEPSCRYTLLSCTTCMSPILVRQTNIGNMAEGDKWDTPFVVFPQTDVRVNPNAPKEIRAAFEEACACYRSQAYTASAIMCRKTIEGVCAEHGVTERNLSASLKKMKEVGLIDERYLSGPTHCELLATRPLMGLAFQSPSRMPKTPSSSQTQFSITCSRIGIVLSNSRSGVPVAPNPSMNTQLLCRLFEKRKPLCRLWVGSGQS